MTENIAGRKKLPWPVSLFLVSLLIPWIVMIGPLSLSVYRFVLIAALFPCLIKWMTGGAGRIRISDILLLAFSIWCFISFAANHGLSAAMQPGGILFIETMSAYLLARCYIRDSDDFRNMIRLAAMLVALLLPFAVYESLTGSRPILETFKAVARTFELYEPEIRMGLRRAQGPFEHPILFGIFCASLLALTHLVGGVGRSAVSRRFLTASVACAAFLSMSSAPIASLAIQGALLSWNWLLRHYRSRWKILWALALAAYLVIEFGSNRTPITFYISYFTFDQGTGWYRIWIWEYASASVLNHPLFGIGFGDWARPSWMASGSLDNFWLVIAVRHGIPGIVLMIGAYLGITLAITFKAKPDRHLENYRLAFLLCMATYLFVGSTVYIWAASYAWFLFLLGSGVWLLDAKPGDGVASVQTRTKPDAALERSRLRDRNVPAVRPHREVPVDVSRRVV